MAVTSRLERLSNSLAALSSRFEYQFEFLRGIGHFGSAVKSIDEVDELYNIDELALQFDDIAVSCREMHEMGEIDDFTLNCINELSELLSSYSDSNDPNLWTLASLRDDNRWEVVRQKASNCLSLIK